MNHNLFPTHPPTQPTHRHGRPNHPISASPDTRRTKTGVIHDETPVHVRPLMLTVREQGESTTRPQSTYAITCSPYDNRGQSATTPCFRTLPRTHRTKTGDNHAEAPINVHSRRPTVRKQGESPLKPRSAYAECGLEYADRGLGDRRTIPGRRTRRRRSRARSGPQCRNVLAAPDRPGRPRG